MELEKLEQNKSEISATEFEMKQHKITEKSCLCVGLANASYIENDMPIKGQQQGVVICPGPNLAYFDKEYSLQEMVQHIYGNTNVMHETERPNLFIKELKMYVDYLQNEINTFTDEVTANQLKKWNTYRNNINEGIVYYQTLFKTTSYFKNADSKIAEQLEFYKEAINSIELKS